MPDWDNTESRESDEDAAWRDLVARFEEPAITTGPTPWPERENVPGQRPQAPAGTDGTSAVHGAQGAETAPAGTGTGQAQGPAGTGTGQAQGPAGTGTGQAQGPAGTGTGQAQGPAGTGTGQAQGPAGTGTDGAAAADDVRERRAEGVRETRGDGSARETREVEGVRGFDDEGVRGAFDADRLPGTREPDVTRTARRDRRPAAHEARGRRVRASKVPPQSAQEDDEGHYVPPAPPPLPRLDPITKGAWAALFGGPAYLVVATAVGWSVPGIAAFLAVAAFVTGFAILVLRMNDPGPGGPDDGDDGAVV